jgi:hypothetical protein
MILRLFVPCIHIMGVALDSNFDQIRRITFLKTFLSEILQCIDRLITFSNYANSAPNN